MSLAHTKNQPHEVVFSSWSAVYSDLNEIALVEAAFNDSDLVPSFQEVSHFNHYSNHSLEQEHRILTPCLLPAIIAVEKAWERAELSDQRNALRGKGPRIRHPRAAVVAGSSLGRISPIISEHTSNTEKKLSPYTLSRLRGNAIAAPIATRFGLGGGSLSLSAASATGGQALWMAAHLIRIGMADQVVVVCTDSLKSNLVTKALHSIGIVASSSHSRPLSSQRDGMRPIEASAAVILESYTNTIKRNFKPLARWTAGSIKNECHHLIAPEPSGTTLKEATQETLNYLGYDISKIDWLSMHATGTCLWDHIESRLALEIFGPSLPHISAFKRTFGHTLGSAGLLEASMLAEGLATQRLPLWPKNTDPKLKLKQNLKRTIPPIKLQRAMMWSAGMGGDVTVNLFEAL